jgi:hypothetical protein
MLSTLTAKSFFRNIFLIFALSVFFSCQKDLSLEDGGPVINPPDLSTKINSSVSGFVTDENNKPVKDAVVVMSSSTVNTDKYGYFEIKNVQVVKNAAFVSVSKTGYFKGIKTYMAKEGKAAFFRIKLLPKTISGNFNSTSGGTVTTATGLTVTLPANAVVNAATNVAYSGTVNVAARYIDPKDAEISKILPGGSLGINSDGAMKLLGDYGSAAIELTGSAGELLQVMTGKKATLVLPISAALQASAPASIPLWSMDESTGLWKQEGTATRSGNTYTGEVSHFSFWDWGAPSSYVYFDCTIVDSIGNPIPNAIVYMEVATTWGSYALGAYTNENGYVGGLIPDNTQFILRVFPSNSFCNWSNPVYSQNITSTNVNISLGNVIMPTARTAIVSGSVVNCSNAPVINGCIIEQSYFTYNRYPVSASGSFSFPILLCNNPEPIVLVGQDFTPNLYGNPVSYSIIAGNNNIGTLSACGNTIEEFMHFSINSNSYSFTRPSAFFYNQAWPWPNRVQTAANRWIPSYQTAHVDFTKDNIATNSIQDLISLGSSEFGDSLITINPIPVYITEFGVTGQYMSGTFSGTMKSYYTPANTFSVSCTFRTKIYF